MKQATKQFVSELAREGNTVRAIRSAAKAADIDLPSDDAKIIKLILEDMNNDDILEAG